LLIAELDRKYEPTPVSIVSSDVYLIRASTAVTLLGLYRTQIEAVVTSAGKIF
jgi:hypothetical protein